ncbi:MAG: DUF4249 domain-containing protein [Odoribacteraceae bacterium]|jgi:hypothetical protein|nr:DUF4249 domain-containing protein [Odoribacteraceae bacterium]
MTLKHLLSLLLLVSCTARVEIDTDEGTRVLVIYGHITTDTLPHAITISRSSGYFATTPPEPLTGALVTLSSGELLYALHEEDTLPGTYRLASPLAGVPGTNYTLTVSLQHEATTETYRATSTMPLTSEIDSIELRPSLVFQQQIEVIGYGTLPANEKNFLSFHLYRNGKQLTDKLNDLFIVDDSYFKQKEMHGVLCQLMDQKEEKSTLVPGDTVTLRIDVLPEEYARFLQQAQQQVRGSNPIFSGPPANISTNIQGVHSSTPVAGFFAAFPTRRKTTIYRPDN